MYQEVHNCPKEMLQIGTIQPSHNPWARTIKDSYSLPRIEDTFHCLNGCVVYYTRPHVRLLASQDG